MNKTDICNAALEAIGAGVPGKDQDEGGDHAVVSTGDELSRAEEDFFKEFFGTLRVVK